MNNKHNGPNRFYILSVEESAFLTKEERDNDYKPDAENLGKRKLTQSAVKGESKASIYQKCVHNKTCSEEEKLDIQYPKGKIIALFESNTSRILGFENEKLHDKDLMVISFRNSKNSLFSDLFYNGFAYKREKFVFFTASAGHSRKSKAYFIRKSLLDEYKDALMCGLTNEIIDAHGGINPNKLTVYYALGLTATVPSDINIDNVIVVKDYESTVPGLTQKIDRNTYKIDNPSENKIKICHTDGCGMALPACFGSYSSQLRAPWCKGLVVPFDFRKFVREANEQYPERKHEIITDVYGTAHDILKEDIKVILTASQFKMYQHYDSWAHYVEQFKKYKHTFGICKKEERNIPNASLNYQSLQMIDKYDEKDIETLAHDTVKRIKECGSSRENMLWTLGVREGSNDLDYLQDSLKLYPELLNDDYCKKIVRDARASMIRRAKGGELLVNGKYLYLVPDLYAFCQHLFMGIERPNGLLGNGEVYTKAMNPGNVVLIRFPVIYKDFQKRTNINSKLPERESLSDWFVSNGIYLSTHDLISKSLQNDFDGDESLVCADDKFTTIVDKNMVDENMSSIVPLVYDAEKAKAQPVNIDATFAGLKKAFYESNVGEISNTITKIVNNPPVDWELVKKLCMDVNYIIDYAKTLYKPIRPDDVKKSVHKLQMTPLPYFMQYALSDKRKKTRQINKESGDFETVEKKFAQPTKSIVNDISQSIPDNTLEITASNLGKFDYRVLMHNKKPCLEKADEIMERYNQRAKTYKYDGLFHRKSKHDDGEEDHITFVQKKIREHIVDVTGDLLNTVDVIVYYIFCLDPRDECKKMFWDTFGEVILENIKKNVRPNTTLCDMCGCRIEKSNSRKYCDSCSTKKEKARKR